ncbi:transposase [Tropicibacter sp. S64]|uniref:transposase n=1 Tax=Tropicibacter sp. S64 TaxID=3415122 RepID=UPI003C7C0BE9
MGETKTYEFRKHAVRMALTSRPKRRQVADDLGVEPSPLTNWEKALRHRDLVSSDDRALARKTERL